jgi:hypothetical protein
MLCLPSCPQINVTYSGWRPLLDTWGKMFGGVIGQSHTNLFTHVTKFANYFLFKFPFPEPHFVETKYLPAHLPSICFLLVSSNYFKLSKSTFTSWHRTTILNCLDWKWSSNLSGKVNQIIIHLLAEQSPFDYRLTIGPKFNVQKCKVFGCVVICDR